MDDFYTVEFIIKKERFYGQGYSSSGGEAATKDLLLRAGLQPNEKVLDVCCGQGGPAMYMARHYGVQVHAIDFSQNLINLGKKRLAACEPIVQQRVQLEYGDITKVQLKEKYYDVLYSKDSITMIENKEKVYENLMTAVRPGGRLFFSDWCFASLAAEESNSPGYQIKAAHGATVSDNVQCMEAAGFKNVKTEDISKNMINYLEFALKQLVATKQAFIQDFDSESYQSIEDRISGRIVRLKKGTTQWVLFTATA